MFPRLLLALPCLALCATAAEPTARTEFHHAPKPLAPGAVTQDWPRFLGPFHNCTTNETKLLHTLPPNGPDIIWEVEKGLGHSAPAIAGGKLVLFHRIGSQERLDCFEAETGKPLWSYAYEAPYQDRFGVGDGTRSNPVIADGRVFTYGVNGQFNCLSLADGAVLWQHDCEKEYDIAPNFFGRGSTPLVLGSRVIVELGGRDHLCAAAFDTATGKMVWQAKHEWGASYASPIPAAIHGRDCVLIFAGGESRPPTGGLLCIDAATGEVLNATAHRARNYASVSASSPAVAGDRVFVSESYGSGGEMIEIGANFQARSAWKAPGLGIYFMTPIVKDGCLIGCDGQNPTNADLVCHDIATGKELWRSDLGGGFGRCNLLMADGGVLCLGEFGDLAWLDLSRTGAKVLSKAKLFHAPDTWALPALSHGLLYVCQDERSQNGKSPRLICYDLRGE